MPTTLRLRCERDVLVEALGTVGRAAGGRSGTAPVQGGLRLELRADRLHLAATDLDLTIQMGITVAGGGDGACVVPARLVTEIVRSMEPGAVALEADDDEIRVSGGRSWFGLRGFPVSEFPRLSLPKAERVVLGATELAEAVRQVIRAASGDDSRPMLTGVLLSAEPGGLRLVATDSYRLAVRDLVGRSVLAEGQRVLVPARALGELQRLLGPSAPGGPEGEREVSFCVGDLDACFEVDSVQLSTRLLEGEFPNYQKLFPSSYPNRLLVGKAALLDAIRRVKLLARDATASVHMAMRAESIELSVATQDVGQAREDIEATYEGSDLTVAFNPTYLADGVEAVAGDQVILETIDAAKPATVRAALDSDYRYLLMPVRVP